MLDFDDTFETVPEVNEEIYDLISLDAIKDSLDVNTNVSLLEQLSQTSMSEVQSSTEKKRVKHDNNNNDNDSMTNYRRTVSDEEEDDGDSSPFDIDDDDDDDHDDEIEYLTMSKSTAPIIPADAEELEAKLARELNALSLQQRDSALYEIHGVADAIEETPELIETSLRDLERQLQKQTRRKSKKSKAYRIAESQSPEYVQRKSFRLLFLQSRMFNVKAACSAILLHFTVKRELFGDSKLSREITQKDLDQDDMASLSNGHFQLLPVCDPAGRYAMFVSMTHAKYKTVINFARVAWYTALSMVRMDTSGAFGKGVVSVIYRVGGRKKIARRDPFTMRRVRNAMPFRVSSLHYCSEGVANATNGRNQQTRGTIIDWVLTFCMESAMRIRTRIHRGTHEQCLESLDKCGIPSELFPVTADGNLRRDRQRAWISSLKALEERQEGGTTTANYDSDATDASRPKQFLVPSQSDVLLGRGRASQTHIGNLRLRLMLEANMEQFESFSERGEKLQFAMGIVDSVKSSGGHFLKLENGVWVAVSDQDACKKVAHDFRTLRTKQITKADDVYSVDADMDIDQGRAVIRKRAKPS